MKEIRAFVDMIERDYKYAGFVIYNSPEYQTLKELLKKPERPEKTPDGTCNCTMWMGTFFSLDDLTYPICMNCRKLNFHWEVKQKREQEKKQVVNTDKPIQQEGKASIQPKFLYCYDCKSNNIQESGEGMGYREIIQLAEKVSSREKHPGTYPWHKKTENNSYPACIEHPDLPQESPISYNIYDANKKFVKNIPVTTPRLFIDDTEIVNTALWSLAGKLLFIFESPWNNSVIRIHYKTPEGEYNIETFPGNGIQNKFFLLKESATKINEWIEWDNLTPPVADDVEIEWRSNGILAGRDKAGDVRWQPVKGNKITYRIIESKQKPYCLSNMYALWYIDETTKSAISRLFFTTKKQPLAWPEADHYRILAITHADAIKFTEGEGL